MPNKFVVALGGSIAFQEKINVGLLKKFRALLIDRVKKGDKFVVIVGGGYPARNYQTLANQVAQISPANSDWIGIRATQLNAELVKAVFGKLANPAFFDKRFKIKNFAKYPIVIAGGWLPGNSTDYVACQVAVDFKLKQVIVLGKPDYVYTADPEKDKSAKPLPKLTWPEYLKLIPKKWQPGLQTPIDPLAARLAQKAGLEVIVATGDLSNFKKILSKQPFKGTVIS